MENEIKMSIINEQGKKIIKNIPENLSSLYQKIGWKLEKETQSNRKSELERFTAEKENNDYNKSK